MISQIYQSPADRCNTMTRFSQLFNIVLVTMTILQSSVFSLHQDARTQVKKSRVVLVPVQKHQLEESLHLPEYQSNTTSLYHRSVSMIKEDLKMIPVIFPVVNITTERVTEEESSPNQDQPRPSIYSVSFVFLLGALSARRIAKRTYRERIESRRRMEHELAHDIAYSVTPTDYGSFASPWTRENFEKFDVWECRFLKIVTFRNLLQLFLIKCIFIIAAVVVVMLCQEQIRSSRTSK